MGCMAFLIGSMKCDMCKLMDKRNVRPGIILPNLLAVAKAIERKVT